MGLLPDVWTTRISKRKHQESNVNLGCRRGGGIFRPNHSVGLRTFLSIDDIELDFVAFLQGLVTIYLDGRIVNEYIRSILSANKAKTLGVIEPLDCAFVLSQIGRA